MSDEAGGASVDRRAVLGERLFGAAIGMFDIYSVYLGDRLGLYRTLSDAGPDGLSATEVGAQAGIDGRYAREWLEQQAAGGIIDLARDDVDPLRRRFRLPDEHAPLLIDPDAPDHLAPLARMLVAIGRSIDPLVAAYRSGGGVPWDDYGLDMVAGQADINRPGFLSDLGSAWFPAIDGLEARLRAQPPARVADIGCGAGWSSIAMVRAYPSIHVDGFDLDERSIEMARHHATEAGLADRLSFHLRDASDGSLVGRYDLVTAFECIHDMSRPVEALRVMRGLRSPGGTVIVADEAVEEMFTPQASEIERFMYGWSITTCLPAALNESPSAGTGAVMRPDTLRAYAREAGFADVEVLPVEHAFWRFYRLVG